MTKLLRRLRRAPHRTVDRLIALAVLIVGELELLIRYGGDGTNLLPHVAVLGFAYIALAFRRTHPLATAVAVLGSWVVVNLFLTDLENLQIPLLAVLMVAYALGAYTKGYSAIAAPVLLFAGMMAIVSTFEDQVFTDYVFPTAFALVVWLGARYLAARTRLVEELHEAAVRAQEADEEATARAAGAERRRIAREMHDVVAHSVSVMVVQAGGARRIIEQDPARAAEAAARIEEVGRAAMAEMRRLLGVLHLDDARAPQPTLRELDALVERSRAAGLPVELTVAGEPRSLPAGKDLAAYRVVQEALTNAIKHAGAAPTEVNVRWSRPTSSSRSTTAAATRRVAVRGGHGLVGMDERVRLYDGELRTGPRRGGGFEVVARLPL